MNRSRSTGRRMAHGQVGIGVVVCTCDRGSNTPKL